MTRLFLTLIVLVSTFLFMGGCSNSLSNQEIAQLQTKEGKAMLFVYRPHNDFWRKKRYSIYIDGNYEKTLVNGFYFTFEKDVGNYKVELKEDIEYEPEVFTLNLDMKAGRIYYLRFGTDGIESHPDFKEVPPSVMQAQEHLIREGF